MAILIYIIMVIQTTKIKGASVEKYSTSIYFLSLNYPGYESASFLKSQWLSFYSCKRKLKHELESRKATLLNIYEAPDITD